MLFSSHCAAFSENQLDSLWMKLNWKMKARMSNALCLISGSAHKPTGRPGWSILSEMIKIWASGSQHQCINPFWLNHIICLCTHSSDLSCWCCSTCHIIDIFPKYKYFCTHARITVIEVNPEKWRNKPYRRTLVQRQSSKLGFPAYKSWCLKKWNSIKT